MHPTDFTLAGALAAVTKVPANGRPSAALASQVIAVRPGSGVENRQAPIARVGVASLPMVTTLIGCSGSVSSVASCWAPLPLKLSV